MKIGSSQGGLKASSGGNSSLAFNWSSLNSHLQPESEQVSVLGGGQSCVHIRVAVCWTKIVEGSQMVAWQGDVPCGVACRCGKQGGMAVVGGLGADGREEYRLEWDTCHLEPGLPHQESCGRNGPDTDIQDVTDDDDDPIHISEITPTSKSTISATEACCEVPASSLPEGLCYSVLFPLSTA